MSLEDDLQKAVDDTQGILPAARAEQPLTGLSWEWDGNQGSIQTPPLQDRPTTWDPYLIDAGLDPAEVEVIEPVQVRGWDGLVRNEDKTTSVVRQHYYRLNVRRRSELLADLPLLLSQARAFAHVDAAARLLTLPEGVDRANIVLWADPQTGKVARRGGSPELVQRVGQTMGRLHDYLERNPADSVVFFDLGDAIEGFENTPGQEFTNDLSLMDQVDLALTLEWQVLSLLAAQRSHVGIYGVGSNHCRWRKGKGALGAPGDDWGIFMLKQLRKQVGIAGLEHVDVRWPDRQEETLCVEVVGRRLGAAHGHQAPRPEKVPDWWAGQVHGGQPLAHADILHTGHFHHLRVQPSGRNPWTDESKWWMQGSTLDNGSDWYRHAVGDDSDPGLVVYTLTRGKIGYPFQHLEVL